MSARRLTKTDAGRAEIRHRTLPLSRAARNLLIVVEADHDMDHWLAQVQGSQSLHLQELMTLGLLAPVPDAPAPRRTRPPELPRIPLRQALQRLDFGTLYDRLTAEARPRLGLFGGYRAILAIERAPDVQALREVALQLVEQVRQAQGDAQAQQLAQALADGRKPRR